MTLHDSIAVGITCVACSFDLRTRRIPNALTLGAALVAIVFSTITGGVHGMNASLLGWLAAAALWLPIYAVGGMGAGDVKLIAAVGAWIGPANVIDAALYAAIVGAGMALVLAVFKGYLGQLFSNVRLLMTHWTVAGFTPRSGLTLSTSGGPRLAYAVPILAGTVVAIWLRH